MSYFFYPYPQGYEFAMYDFSKAAVHGNSLYCLASTFASDSQKWQSTLTEFDLLEVVGPARRKSALVKLFTSDNTIEKVERIVEFDDRDARLFPQADRLLIVGKSRMWELHDDEAVLLHSYAPLGVFSQPFHFDTSLAVIEDRPTGQFLAVLKNGEWDRIPLDFGQQDVASRSQVLTIDGTNHLFFESDHTIFHKVALPFAEAGDASDWSYVTASEGGWQALILNGRPSVILADEQGLRGFQLQQGAWTESFNIEDITFVSADFFPVPMSDGSISLVFTGFPGSFSVYSLTGDEVKLVRKHGGAFPFQGRFMKGMLIGQLLSLPLPLALALILSRLMSRHRITTYSHRGATVRFASVGRRAVSQIIDSSFFFVGALPFLYTFSGFLASSDFGIIQFAAPAKTLLLTLGLAFLWSFFLLIVYSVLEGYQGITPGKLVCRIRVLGTDLDYCGFWRALIRNFLEMVDGFYYFLVGILLVAFTENWQRLGDMAAKTIVIEKPEAHTRPDQTIPYPKFS